ncbi:CheY-like superfamily, partial [Cynara cardunculus var. scolymus]
MVHEVDYDHVEDMEVEVLSSMWPEDIDEAGKKFNVEKPGVHQDMLEDLAFIEEPSIVDFKRLVELTSYSEKGSSQLSYLVKNWEYKQENAVRLLREELDNLSKQQHEVELKKLEILEQHRFEEESYGGDKRPVSVLDEVYEAFQDILKRADNFLHFVLQNAPVVIGHQDKDLRYRFIYNHFPSLGEEDIIGKTDTEIFKGGGVKESQDFKREVLERGLPAKREITFETQLFGAKTFLIYVEPVFSKDGETIGVNYMGMEMTDQVKKREKMAKLREEIAVQKAKETELNKTIHITEETMRAKQMLATMSHEIRSPLSGVVSMTEILSKTKLDKDQKQLLRVMLSSGDLVLQLINDILDLSKVESGYELRIYASGICKPLTFTGLFSGVMKLEATKFRPREVIKHVLQTAAASLKRMLILEGHVADDVPVEVIGDVLRIRQILTNLISNAIKFTHEGKVQINLYVIADPYPEGHQEPKINMDDSSVSTKNGVLLDVHEENEPQSHETVVWIRCDVKDTGIGIPGTFQVELMGGHLTVSSKEHCGSTFTFILPHKLSHACDGSDDTDEFGDMADNEDDDITCGFFQFQPCALGSTFSSNGSVITHKYRINVTPKEIVSSMDDDDSSCFDTSSEPESSSKCNSENENTNCIKKEKESHDDLDLAVDSCSPSDHQFHDRGDLCETCEARKDSNRSSECSSSSSNRQEVLKSATKPKILLVEDHMVNVMVARRMMRQLNQDIDVVNNGAEAVRAVQTTRLIRSFEKTGNWDEARKAGVDFPSYDRILQEPRKRIPIIAMTANAMSESAEECFQN